MSSKQRILMTGATGFLGSNLLIKLVDVGYEVIILKRSFSDTKRINGCLKKIKYYDIDQEGIEKCFTENRIDVFIHCATDYGRKNTDPLQIIEANLILPLKILEIGLKNSCFRFINTDTILDKGINSYSLSKKQFSDWLKMYSDRAVCVNVVLEHFYGPFDDRTKFVPFIIDKMLSNAAEVDLTFGQQKRDFIYIDDVVDAFTVILENIANMDKGFYNYEIGADKLVTIKEIVSLIKEMSENKVTRINFGAVPYRANEVMEPKIDTSSIRQIGWTPKTKLIDGLRKTLEMEIEQRK